jgi:hypothetical protein
MPPLICSDYVTSLIDCDLRPLYYTSDILLVLLEFWIDKKDLTASDDPISYKGSENFCPMDLGKWKPAHSLDPFALQPLRKKPSETGPNPLP